MASKHFVSRIAYFSGLALILGACRSDGDNIEELLETGFAAPQLAQDFHRGPLVAVTDSGPGRFVSKLLQIFDGERAMRTVAFIDQYYRAPANDGYLAVLDHVEERLRAAGFGGRDKRLELREIVSEMRSASWTPKSGSIELLLAGGQRRGLHAFDVGNEPDRTILPIGAPSCDVTGRVRTSLGDLEPGDIFVTDAELTQVYGRAKIRGASAILSSFIETFNEDPTGQDRHLDAIQYVRLPEQSTLPVAQISPRNFQIILDELERDSTGVKLHFQAQVDLEVRPMRTVVAAIKGTMRPDECVASAAHIQEPGANDNASGVAGLLEGAVSLAGALKGGVFDWPDRTLVFIWGDEYAQTQAWIADTKRTPIAGISSDMVGNSQEKTGSRALLERNPDPGALVPLPPDEHTPWGAGEVRAEMLNANGLSVVARCAMVDVGLEVGGWESADHPWEGGSDHDVFISRKIPAILLWHFTDFTYHTSLDRLEMVDADELERTEVVVLATMLSVADPKPSDLNRYVRSIELERLTRIEAAEAEEDLQLVEAWNDWSHGAVGWARALCLGIPIEEAIPPMVPGKDESIPAEF